MPAVAGYIDGVTVLDLTCDMYEQAALELERYQGKLWKRTTMISRYTCQKNS